MLSSTTEDQKVNLVIALKIQVTQMKLVSNQVEMTNPIDFRNTTKQIELLTNQVKLIATCSQIKLLTNQVVAAQTKKTVTKPKVLGADVGDAQQN